MRELLEHIGTKAMYDLGKIKVAIEIIDVRKVYGRIDYLIRPVSGKGEVWVAAYNLGEIEAQ